MTTNTNVKRFIEKANNIHNNLYDYSKLLYKTMKCKVIIICRKHGDFSQIPQNHLEGYGCPVCVVEIRCKQFIENSITKHNNKYDYSKVNYINSSTKVIIICKQHGEFKQTPSVHLENYGCTKCSKKYRMNTEEFIKEAIIIHGIKYDYSSTIFKSKLEKVNIICKKHGEFSQEAKSHLKGSGCSKCIGNNKLDTKEFIEKAIIKHGHKYDYSKINYINSLSKVIIICKQHGEFIQIPSSHLIGSGCFKCADNNKLDTKEFIEKSILKHDHKYDYSKINYINSLTKVIIICKQHGEFKQTPTSHLKGSGCSKCAGNNTQSNTTEFVEKAIMKYGNRYDYSKVNYINNSTKVYIICIKHGEFSQTPQNHLAGYNCKLCGIEETTIKMTSNIKEFIKKAVVVHKNTYDYSKVEYKLATEKIKIICKKHGEFNQTPHVHLNGSGCRKCCNNHSKVQIRWLEFLEKYYNINIQHIGNGDEFVIPATRYKADGYCKENNTIYEFHEDYFHGNPKVFNSEEVNKLCKSTHGDLYKQTLKKEKRIKDLGFNLIVMWESDWVRINKCITILQKNMLKQAKKAATTSKD